MNSESGDAPNQKARLHCKSLACGHQTFKAIDSHKHGGKSLKADDFEECPGASCERCKLYVPYGKCDCGSKDVKLASGRFGG